MSKKNKLVEKFLSVPSDLTWEELLKVLSVYGYNLLSQGKTVGSGRKLADAEGDIIVLHQPHPSNVVKKGALKVVLKRLKEKGKIKDE